MTTGTRVEMADGTFAMQVSLVNTGQASGATKSEDAAAASGDSGVPSMFVQTASPADAASAGDYAFGQMKDGRIWVRDLGGLSASASFTPAAAEYTAHDIYGAAGTFALSAPSGCSFLIQSVTLTIVGATIETTVWRLHLFNVTPPSALADNAAFTLPSCDRASYLGYITIPQVVDLVDTQWIESNNIGKQIKLSGTSVFGYLVAESTITPAAVAHTVTIHGTPI